MSAEPTKVQSESAAKVRRVAQYRTRVSDFVGSRRGKMFGIAEVVGLAGSCLILGLLLLSYLYFLVPARSRVASLINDNKQLQTNVETLRGVNRNEQNSSTTVQQITTSLDKFETDYLPRQDEGRMQLYDELNQLIIKNALRNTAGPTYTALEPEGTKAAGGKNLATKWQSFYPGVAVMVTVEGQYENVRRFIRDVERSKQFVVINEVEIQRASQNNAPVLVYENGTATPAAAAAPAAPAAQGSGTRAYL